MTDRKLIVRSTLVSLLLHLLIGALTWNLSLLDGEAVPTAQADDEVELILLDDAALADPPADRPTAYTEVPERLATEQPPERADFLALHNAQAADRLPGGRPDDSPGTEQEADFPQVQVAPEDLAGADGVAVETEVLPTQDARPEAREKQEEAEREAAGEPADDLGEWLLQPPQEGGPEEQAGEAEADPEAPDVPDWLSGQPAPSILKEGDRRDRGDRGFDFDQRAQSLPGTNTQVDGDFSLSTYEWEWAPWLHRFAQDLHRNWMAPYAYRLGIISGFTRIRLVVEKDGRPSAMEIIEENGHESLHKASTAALQSFAPYAPLPPDFPEENLVILLSLHYPAWKR